MTDPGTAERAAGAAPFLEMRGVSKAFAGVPACDAVDLVVERGEIHALVGENGAGKSTLMCLLAGLYRLDAGAIHLEGRRVQLGSPRRAIELGIGMVHQQFLLVPRHTVAENVVLGLRRPRLWLRLGPVERRLAELGARHGLAVDPRARVWQLSVGEQQRVEILKVLYRGARLLVLDEPTAVLTPAEVQGLFAALRSLAAAGTTCVFISHKVDEVLAVADRVTVLRRGRVVAAGVPTAGLAAATLARLLVDRELPAPAPAPRPATEPGPVVLELRSLGATGDRGAPALTDVSLAVRGGEIYALAGVAGNGQRELAEVVTGLRRAAAGGVLLAGRRWSGDGEPPVTLSHVPEDRVAVGSAARLSLADNLALRAYRRPPLARGPWLDRAALRAHGRRLIAAHGIVPPDERAAAGALSGGNLQRLVLARELDGAPQLVVAVQPTRGLDLGATADVHRLLRARAAAGAAVLLVSTDLDEVLTLADRVGVLCRGRLVGELAAGEANAERLGLLMAGVAGGGA